MLKQFTKEEIKEGKITAIIAHLTFVGCIIAVFMNLEPKNRFAGFYVKQTIGLHLFFFIMMTLASLIASEMAFYAFYLSFFVLWIYSFVGALSNDIKPLPKIGVYFQKWFNKLSA
ncbi:MULTISPECIES: hypothetical protein [Myroides]|uniref:hypothetical protein n=1 Tax=Myroides TaxID=76831 RepID=UPI001303E1D2|nr:hypothetical protein [Myroides phaeus]